MTRRFALLVVAFLLSAPAAAAESEEGANRRPRGQAAPGVGMDPSDMVLHEVVMPGDVDAEDEAEEPVSDMRFQFHGFLRVPLRLGIGNGKDFEGNGESETKVHIPPQIPDGSYLNWRYTNNMGGPWTELKLIYGNNTVAANVSIAAYTVTDGSYRDLIGQLGINQSFVSLNFPELFGKYGGIVANVGVFSNRYGAAGRYSADKYDTYLFGATHVAGESIRAFVDVSRHFTLHIEQGFGGKLDVAPFVSDTFSDVPYLPYPGDEQQGATLLNHAHLGVSYDDKLTLAGHFLMSWTDDARPEDDEKDGRIMNFGADLKMIDFFFGEGYLGYSHIFSKDPMRVAGAFEALHSVEGWSLKDNYFPGDESTGNGTVDSILFQYTFSLARFLWHPREFWGQGRDLLISGFGMYNIINSDDDEFEGATQKLKFGGDVIYTPLSWLGLGARYDLVQPNMDDNTESFHVASGMLILRSSFISHERIVLQYSHYFYGDNVRPAWPHEEFAPDSGVIKLSAIMWW